ncbi:UNVERIFIED_CONTAM: hypothetical protein Scaly_0691000 [Sesamum calycinum]|uniref:MULE transposase domain-containing protein n=1 Tax=Sesamum calycinum TaxID=2727403 RepID=A0AAW2R762_9LAMI
MNCEGQGQGQDNDGIGSVCEGIEEMMNCEGQGEQGHGGDGECQENEMDRGASTDSETPSLVLEDLEVSSDEDIFLNKNPSKRDLMHKLRRVMKKRVKKTEKQPEVEVNENWFSDDGENDELESLHGSDNEDSLPKHEFFSESTNIKTCQLKVGMKFHDAKHFRETLRDWCIRGGFDIEYGAHTCARTYNNKLAKASYLAKRMESAIRDHPNIPVLQLKNTILRKCKMDVSRQKVQRAKREALEKIRGSDSVQYEKLWDYCETVRKFNPGSKLILKKLEGSNPPIFDKMAVASCCRRDGNDNMFPIAMAVVQVENRENWTWFLGELLDDIGGLGTSMWSFISDRQKGLIEALKDLVPDSEHRFCLRHILVYEPLKPPKIKTKRGRPKKLRRRGPNEMQTTSTRKGLTHTCTKCLGKGHNKRNCTNEPHPKSKFYKGISHEEILVEGSQIPPASQEHELQSEATRGTKVEQTSVGSSAATHPTSTPPSSNVQTSVGSSAAKHPISTHPSNQEIGYQGPRNDALMGGRSRGSGGNTSRNKTPSISQVLERIKERSKKRPWRP